MIVFKLILFTLFISVSQCKIPDKVYCANKECDGPISKAKTLLSYASADPDLISFRPNSDAIVYMKSAGPDSELWYAKINGISGFVNNKFLREYKILQRNLEVVPYEAKNQASVVNPDKVQHPHEVFEGTTIYTTETTVNEAQQDSSTESPSTSSNENLTPSLDSAIETPNQNVDDNNNPNVPSQDNKVIVINEYQTDENSELPSNDEPSTLTAPSHETPTHTDVSNDVDQSAESTDKITDITKNEVDINFEQNGQLDEVNQELPKEMPSEMPHPQQLLASASGASNSEAIIEVPEKQDYLQNTLTESEHSDSKEHNTSSLNNNLENDQVSEDSTKTSNVPNGNYISEPVTNPIDGLTENPTNDPDVNPTIEQQISTTAAPVVNPTNVPVESSPDNVPIFQQINKVISPIFSKTNAGNQYIQASNVPMPVENVQSYENTAPTMEPFPSSTETSDPIQASTETLPTVEPIQAPPTETVPPVSVESVPTTTTETIPAVTETVPTLETIPAVTETVPTPETTPPTVNLEAPPTTEIPTQDLSYTYTTTPAPYSLDEFYNSYGTSESDPTEDTTPSSIHAPVEDIISALPDTPEDISSSNEAPVQDENTEGFFSNMYSSVADIWPSSTESPESLYNTEYPTYESEKADGEEGFSFMKYIISNYYSIMGTSEESKALFASVGQTCFTDEFCDGMSNDGSNRLLTFLLTTASSVLLFTLGYYYIDNKRQDGRLIGTINSLQRDLLFTTKECEILKEELTSTKNKLAGIEDSSFGMDDMVQSLKEEINELKATNDRLRNSLDDNEKLLRVSENTAGELQNTLSEVENTLSELLAERANSEEQIVELNGKIQAFEEELISVSRERDNFQLKYVSAETALEEFKKQKKQFEEVNQQLAEAKNTIELQKHENEALKDAIIELKSGMSADVDVTSFIDHTEIKAKLSKALQEKNLYEIKFEKEHKERTRLAEELKTAQETLNTTNQNATEALTRLEVLGKYFQERESELLKELSAKESLWLSKQGESASTVEKIELLQQEVQRHKEKCDALTLELAEQESSRRSALSEVEARAHAAWLEARAAKRDADAARDDAAALRRKLASLSAADGAVSPHHKVSSPLEGADNPVLPPPLPPMFLPPPLLPPLPRPPPLGRLPSPHPQRYGDRRYSPDSRYSPESRYSPDSRYSPETVRYSPDSRYSPRTRRLPYSPRSRRRSRSRERYDDRGTRSRNGPAHPPPDTETEYNSDSPSRQPRRRGYSTHSGPSSGSGCSSESDK